MSSKKKSEKSASDKPVRHPKGSTENPYRISDGYFDFDDMLEKPGVWEFWTLQEGSVYGKGKINWIQEDSFPTEKKALKGKKEYITSQIDRARRDWEWKQNRAKKPDMLTFRINSSTTTADIEKFTKNAREALDEFKNQQEQEVDPFVEPTIHVRIIHHVVVIAEEVVE